MQETQETWVCSLGWEDSLEKEMAPHSSILAWKIPRTEEAGGLHTVHGVSKSRTRLSDHAAANLMGLSCSASPHFFFLMKAVFENFILFVLGMLLYSMWEFGSLTRIGTYAPTPELEAQSSSLDHQGSPSISSFRTKI